MRVYPIVEYREIGKVRKYVEVSDIFILSLPYMGAGKAWIAKKGWT